MGAWGKTAFDNDPADDWIYDTFLESGEVSALTDARQERGVPAYDDERCVALAAAEIIAAARGYPHPKSPEDLADWLAANTPHIDQGLVRMAIRRVTQIGTASALRDLWEETDSLPDWTREIDNLRGRLDSAQR